MPECQRERESERGGEVRNRDMEEDIASKHGPFGPLLHWFFYGSLSSESVVAEL